MTLSTSQRYLCARRMDLSVVAAQKWSKISSASARSIVTDWVRPRLVVLWLLLAVLVAVGLDGRGSMAAAAAAAIAAAACSSSEAVEAAAVTS